MGETLLNGFIKSDIKTVIEGLKNGESKQVIFDYAKSIGGGRLTMRQGWILEELHHVKNHGFGIWGLV